MAAAGGASNTRSLQYTPTWALATVCFIFIFLGLFVEHSIHLLGHVSNDLSCKTHDYNSGFSPPLVHSTAIELIFVLIWRLVAKKA